MAHGLHTFLLSSWLSGVPCASAVGEESSVPAREQATTSDELESIAREISELRTRNSELNGRLDDRIERPWLDACRMESIRGLVRDVLADSSRRTNLQDTGINVGYSRAQGFHITSPDNAFHLRLMGESQVRWVFNRNPSGEQYSNAQILEDRDLNRSTVSGSKTGSGFQIRNLKVKLLGHVIDPSWEFKIEMAFATDGVAEFQDAYLNKDLGDGFSFRIGQFKAPWLREQLVSSVFQLAADRSIIDGYFNAGRAVGLQGQYRTDSLSLRAFYGNGFQSVMNADESYTNFLNSPTAWSFAGRVDWKLLGVWEVLQDFNARVDQEPGVMLGAAAMGQRFNGNAAFNDPFNINLGPSLPTGPLIPGPDSIDGTKMYGITADVTAKWGGWSFYAAGVWQHFDLATPTVDFAFPVNGSITYDFGAVNSWGVLVQGGYLLTDDLELFARYAYLAPDLDDITIGFSAVAGGPPISGSRTLSLGNTASSVLTLGANYFITENLKFTLDWGINFNSGFVGLSEGALASRGWVPTNSSSEWNIRFQTQLLF
ncbi:MAG: porin [Planctomycetota bacterium]|nr:porin [Planctomycetota bacterium]